MLVRQNLVSGTILARTKRFFAHVRLDSGGEVVAHCTNTGAMTSCWEPGDAVLLEPADKPGRKLPYTWLAARRGGAWVGVETGLPNRVVAEVARQATLPGLPRLVEVRTEVRYGREKSRIDVWGRTASGQEVFVEVKNTTLRRGPLALFPDAVTERGTKHLRELTAVAREGHLAASVFFVHRADVEAFAVARDVDPDYAAALEEAAQAGVRVLPLRVALTPSRTDAGWTLRWEVEGLHPLARAQ